MMKESEFRHSGIRHSGSGARKDAPAGEFILGTRPRLLTEAENALLQEWLAATDDIDSAYVSRRHNDDPALRRRIVVTANMGDGPAHIIHAPVGRDCWMVLTLRPGPIVRQLPSLASALNSIRPVLCQSKRPDLLPGAAMHEAPRHGFPDQTPSCDL